MATRKPGTAVLLVGAGRMGGALLKGWGAARSFSAIHVVEPVPSDTAKALARTAKIRLHPELDLSRIPSLAAVVLALKPQVIKSEGKLLHMLGETGALILSIAAGVTSKFL